MVLQLVEATEDDAPRSVAIETEAYGPNGPVGLVLYPGPRPTEGNPRADELIKQRREDPDCRWFKIVDTDLDASPEERMIAFAQWHVWTTPRTSIPSGARGPGSNPEACDLFFGGMNRKRHALMRGKPYVYLKLLHTQPKHQKRGAASLLLEWGLEEADRLGIPAFLESSQQGRRLYEKWGFREVETLTVDFSPWGGPSSIEVPLMLREPKGQQSSMATMDQLGQVDT
ncbi:hypothetical protein G7Z17_g5306 [Cylindrodendrum hubeiense]|uniref:N-acetyltransferase domain-containing protein n=1 Tax=Cylindrodendrum hubeiense TaxID=595255 RepID=A0A9P5LHZ2_9HYPO|nr:hypothetical protein G7Z17_g5306 [Cylindrodendrum hubeiense]